ncbi:hypothetical protein QR680_006219 [Steinernema hermaphroditum]|uniref:TIL domain-containing protein n=1 Tax=Steinernema hermaphroditum TaxID=289476 RepID=A0AA39LX20_9BILA|nr:hypothetical protein QR680_006219 [Steinernema hermaphroditum]
MTSQSILLVVLLVGAVLANVSQQKCGANQQWTDCGYCEGSCDNPNPICTLQCRKPGCYCLRGFVRGPNGDCISQKKCRALKVCPKNEVWLNCGTCEGTCDNVNPICTRECKPAGCYCPAGHVRDEDGTCTPVGQCPKKCGKNEYWTTCGTCDQFCEQPWGGPQACTFDCKFKCECLPGYVRGWDGKCIKKNECTVYPECAYTTCPANTTCVWTPRWCFTTPCPQVSCLPINGGGN